MESVQSGSAKMPENLIPSGSSDEMLNLKFSNKVEISLQEFSILISGFSSRVELPSTKLTLIMLSEIVATFAKIAFEKATFVFPVPSVQFSVESQASPGLVFAETIQFFIVAL